AELGALTPPYASPEMIRGEAPAAADDVFALGIVAYELLTGRDPFDRMPAETARIEGVQPPVGQSLQRLTRRAIARAQACEPAAADDVFALGIVAYELLTGRHPFDRMPAETERLEGVKPPVVPSLPRRQRRALARALAFERDARQADAGVFLKELEGPSPLRT